MPGEGFDFLGYHFENGTRWPRRKSLKKLKDAIRSKTGRSNGHSLAVIIEDVNRTLRGWFEYFKHSQQMDLSLDRQLGATPDSKHPAKAHRASKALAEDTIISAGQTSSFGIMGFSAL